jgi:tRNA (guanine-N7-)-methyltransferase
MPRERTSRSDYPDRFIVAMDDPARPASATALFDRPAPLEVELGCGRGRFLEARAAACPDVNFIGVDRLLLRLRKCDLKFVARGLTNARVVHGDALRVCEEFLPPGGVRTFYLFFLDPWPKRRHHRRRLFSPKVMELLHRLLEPGGALHIATDHADYFQAARRLLTADPRLEPIAPFEPTAEEQTDFEALFRGLGRSIHRCSARKRLA